MCRMCSPNNAAAKVPSGKQTPHDDRVAGNPFNFDSRAQHKLAAAYLTSLSVTDRRRPDCLQDHQRRSEASTLDYLAGPVLLHSYIK
jgi:hypothetical protein